MKFFRNPLAVSAFVLLAVVVAMGTIVSGGAIAAHKAAVVYMH